MGTDIHLFVERKNPNTGAWEFVDPKGVAPQDSFDKENDYWSWYGGRSYALFSILANVRNGVGFGGSDSGDGYKPIAMPRGTPEDASEAFRAEFGEDGGYGHSASWLTLQEILDYDWTQTTTRRGVLGATGFFEMGLAKDGRPTSWSGGVYGQDIRTISVSDMENYVRTSFFIEKLEAEAKRFLEATKKPGRENYHESDKNRAAHYAAMLEVARLSYDSSYDSDFEEDLSYFVRMGWRVSYADSAGWFLSTTVPALQELDENPENIRLVFFFDS